MFHVWSVMILSDESIVEKNKEITRMKKILALAIGFGLVLGTVSFAQDKMADTTKTEKKKKSKKKSTDTTSTEKKM
jgi:hypothetical protein